MKLCDLFTNELIKSIPNLVVALITLLLGWFVGLRVTHYWNIKKTRKELNIEDSKNFHVLYGEFFSVWKLWNYYIRDVGEENFPDNLWWQVMDRASIAEGKLEALLVSIACERNLRESDIETLGLFRQAYQQLRQAIRDNKPLEWNSSDDPEYAKFKELSPKVANIILSKPSLSVVNHQTAADQLKEVTANKWEVKWSKLKNQKNLSVCVPKGRATDG